MAPTDGQGRAVQAATDGYSQLFSAMQEGAVVFTAHGVEAMNPAAVRILGRDLEALRRQCAAEGGWLVHADSAAAGQTAAEDPVARCLSTGAPESGRMFRLCRPGSDDPVWIIANLTPLFFGSQSQPDRVLLTCNEITARIRLRESRKARLFLLEHAPRWNEHELVRETLARVATLTRSPAALLLAVDGDPPGLRLAGRVGASAAEAELACALDDLPDLVACVRRQRTVVVNRAAAAPMASLFWGRDDIRRLLAAPLHHDARPLALLAVGGRSSDYDDEDAALVQRFAELLRDLVDHKRMEADRQESRRKLNALISNLPGMAFSVEADRDRTLRFASDGCLELTGRTAAELTAAPTSGLADLIHPEDRERVFATVQWAVAEGTPYEVEYRLLHADGRERVILERAAPVPSDHGAAAPVEGFATDITAQKDAARQIAQSHQQLLTILDSIEACISVVDLATHEILFGNRTMREVFGEGALGRPCHQVLQNREAPCDFCTSDRLFDQHGEPGPVCQWEHCSPVNGRWYVNYDRAVRWINDQVVRLQVALDITERRESELKLRQVQKMEVIGLLAGGVAHDFNNILSVILGYAAMALAELGDASPRVRCDLDQIQQAGLRARDLVRQILTFCHRSEESFQPLRPQLILKEVVKMLRSSFPATITIVSRIAAAEGTVLADPSQLHQVLMNLCTNALHAMKNGGELSLGLDRRALEGGPLRHELRQLAPGPYLVLSVRDTGCGIPAEILERIFDPFFTTKAEDEGTGLGLAMVQSIVASHKGAVTVDSRVGEGTEVCVYLPELVHADTAVEGAEEEQLPTGTESILIVDDEPAVVLVLQRFLETLGYRVESFTESPRAFEAYARDVGAWDLVLTDMTMPRFTGLAISRAMLALRPDQPIIICTGYSDSIDEDRAREEGIRELLAKPVALETLARAVRRALDHLPPRPATG